jgi:hypothetical protein
VTDRICLSALFLALALAAGSTTPAYACQLSPPQPADESLRAPPQDAVLAAKAVIRRIIPNGPMTGMPHEGFRLELELAQVFKGNFSPPVVVAYGPCHHVPGDVGSTINVLARRGFDNELVAY